MTALHPLGRPGDLDTLLKALRGNPNHDQRGRFASVFAPVRATGEQRGRTLAAVPLDAAHIPALAHATADLLVRTAAVRLPDLTGPTLRVEALRAARQTAAYMRAQGLAIVNHGSGALIELSTTGLKHAKSMTGDERAARLMFRLPSALSRAVYFKTELPDPRKAHRLNIVAYHKFAVPVEDNGGLALAILHVEEDDRGAFYYDAAVSPELGRLGGKPPGPDIADQGDRETGRHRAYHQLILDALKVKPGLGAVHTFFRKSLAPWVPIMQSPVTTPVLIDLQHVPCNCADHALETLHKAIAEDRDAALLWRPHESPYLRTLVEVVYQAGARHLQAAQDALFAALGLGRPVALLRKADAWTDDEIAAVKARLNKPLTEYRPADWLELVDLIVQTRIPPEFIAAQADLLAWKAALAGALQAIAEGGTTARPADLGALMDHVATGPDVMPLAVARTRDAAQVAAMDFAKARIGLHLRGLIEAVRQRMSLLIVRHIEERGLGRPAELATALREAFGTLNHDWRRIAITEAGETANTAYLASLPHGSKVKRVEHYEGACPFCRKIDGMVFTWSTEPLGQEQGWTHVWPGKTNVGRSASPRKQTAGGLVERAAEELWWPAAGLQHPNCFIDGRMPVYTAHGWRSISAIQVGDLVLTHRGRFRAVNWVLGDTGRYRGPIVSLRVSNDGKNSTPVSRMTPEHPVLTDRGWVNAGRLVAGDRIVTMARKCPTCNAPFVNPKFPDVVYCCNQCIPKTGQNQFSTDDQEERMRQIDVTRNANFARMRNMTVEQRKEITKAAREALAIQGYGHLQTPEIKAKGGKAAARNNYSASTVELAIAAQLESLGAVVKTQHRVRKGFPDQRGQMRYWWLDLALPKERIAVEIDGEPWHGRLSNGRDERRDADLQASDWTVLRFPANEAAENPSRIAALVMRVAMNHGGEYLFGTVRVEQIKVRESTAPRLYNFGVDEDESYVIRGGLVVHNCRGRWLALPAETSPGVDPEFSAWLRKIVQERTEEVARRNEQAMLRLREEEIEVDIAATNVSKACQENSPPRDS